MNNKKVPEIRFSGFSDEWEEVKLINISEIYDGTHQTPIYKETGIMFLSVEDIKCLKSNKFISKEAFEAEFKVFPQKGDVLMTRIGDVGTVNVVQSDELIAYYVSLALLKPIKVNSCFLAFSLSSPFVQKEIWKRTLHIAFPKKINKNEIEKINIYISSQEEQTEIGNFFKQLDEKINLNQKELETLKQTKQAFLQKMFPKEGKLVPEIRFSGFKGNWEEKKLGEITNSFQYGLNARAIEYDGENKYIRITDIDEINRNFIQDNLTSPDINLSEADSYLLSEGDILFARTGASVGKTFIYRKYYGKVYFAGFLIKTSVSQKTDANFIYQNTFTENYYKFVRLTSQRSGQPGINATEYASYVLFVPIKEEQTQIGNFFKQLDEKINLQEKELETLKQTKQAFLQKMFI